MTTARARAAMMRLRAGKAPGARRHPPGELGDDEAACAGPRRTARALARGYTTSAPQPSTATVARLRSERRPSSGSSRCAAASTPVARPLTTSSAAQGQVAPEQRGHLARRRAKVRAYPRLRRTAPRRRVRACCAPPPLAGRLHEQAEAADPRAAAAPVDTSLSHHDDHVATAGRPLTRSALPAGGARRPARRRTAVRRPSARPRPARPPLEPATRPASALQSLFQDGVHIAEAPEKAFDEAAAP